MRSEARIGAIKGKLHHYGDEVAALKSGGVGYALLFAPLLLLLLPVLLLELALLWSFGWDPGLLQSRPAEAAGEHDDLTPPTDLVDLLPLARRWGVGDAELREQLVQRASPDELAELVQQVAPRVQRIADWAESLGEQRLRHSATAGHFIFLLTALEEAESHLGAPEP